jgi:hypothetical protein
MGATAIAQNLKAGWFHTGDLMRRGDHDELWFFKNFSRGL